MTGPGTNTYLVGTKDVVVIDPGPLDDVHLERVVAACDGKLRYVVVTHTHRDHAPAAMPLARATGATLLGFDARDGFVPDGIVRDGDRIDVDGWRLDALFTPGHASNHLCFVADRIADRSDGGPSADPLAGGPVRVVFSGDHVMEGSTVVIAPPDGDMADYFASLERLLALSPTPVAIAPGHGQVIDEPRRVVNAYLAHRRERERAVVTALEDGPSTAAGLVPDIYGPLDPRLVGAASRSLWAHLRKLAVEQRVTAADVDDLDTTWSVV